MMMTNEKHKNKTRHSRSCSIINSVAVLCSILFSLRHRLITNGGARANKTECNQQQQFNNSKIEAKLKNCQRIKDALFLGPFSGFDEA
jgi:hypothetical protein